jgi:two-component system, response regulator / RNA-binding antiterminator
MRLRILLMTDHGDRTAMLEQALGVAHHQVVAAIRPDDDLCFYARQARPDAVVVSLATPDPALVQQLEQLSREQPLPVVVFADRSDATRLRAAVKAGVSSYVVDGLEVARVTPVLEAALVRFREFQALRLERDAAVARLSERKVIDRAKGVLMQRRGLSEDAAYQTLRRMAMDRGKRLADVAESIITAEEMLARDWPARGGKRRSGE